MSAATAALGEWVRRALFDNLRLKVMAMLASVGLFYLVHGTEDARVTVPVQTLVTPPAEDADRMLLSDVPAEVRVTIRGSRSVVTAFRQELAFRQIQMDLSSGERTFWVVSEEAFEVPAGVEIVRIAPSVIPLTWVDRARREVPVHLNLEGQVADGHVILERSARPRRVRITGPANEVRRIHELETDAIDVSGLRAGTHSRQTLFERLPTHVAADPGSRVVVVNLRVEQQMSTMALGELTLRLPNRPGLEVQPERVRVSLAGPVLVLEAVDVGRVEARVTFPEDLSVEDGAREVPVVVRGLPEGLAATAVPATVSLRVQAPRPPNPDPDAE